MIYKKIRNKLGSYLRLFVFCEYNFYRFFKLLLRVKASVKIRVGGFSFFVRNKTDLQVAKTFTNEELLVLKSLTKQKPRTIIDAGAYVGISTKVLSVLFKEAKILAIEPNSENFEVLKKNTQNLENVQLFHGVFLATADSDKVELYDRGTGPWGFTAISKPLDHPVTFIEEVNVLTWNQAKELLGASDIDLVKMDIEGSELGFYRNEMVQKEANMVFVENHERIINGIDEAFDNFNKQRVVYKYPGEKYLSVKKTHQLSD